MTVQVTDRLVRIETDRSSGSHHKSPAVTGEYMLFNGIDSSVTSVTPANRRATVMVSNAPSDMVRSTQVHYHPGATRQLRDIGPGEAILGHATERYQATMNAVVDFTMLDATCTRSVNATNDYWIAPDVDMLPAAQQQMRAFGMEDLASGGMVSNAPPVTLPKGTALRTVSRMTLSNGGTALDTVTRTSEYLEFSHGPVDTARFTVPAGYQTLDLRAQLATSSGRLDSLMRVGAAKSIAKMCSGAK